jgi:hypothetical protein
MKTEFCSKCGAKIEYNFAPPNFCAKCGNSLREGAAPSRQQAAESIASTSPEEEEKVPQLDKLQYTVSYEGFGSQKMKLGDLAMQENSNPREGDSPKKKGKKRGAGKALGKEELLLKSVAECKSVGNQSRDVSGK